MLDFSAIQHSFQNCLFLLMPDNAILNTTRCWIFEWGEYFVVNEAKQKQTRQKIADAFMHLYAEKHISQIHVRDITDLAGLNRATFYVYYRDVYDLLDSIENDMINKVNASFGLVEFHMDFVEMESFFQSIIKTYRESGEWIPILMSHPGSNFPLELKDTVFKNLLCKMLRAKSTFDFHLTAKAEYALEYQISAVIGMLAHWLHSDPKISIENLLVYIKEFTQNNLITVLVEETAKFKQS